MLDATRVEAIESDRNYVTEVNRTPRGDFILVLAGGLTVTCSEGFRTKVRDYLTSLRIAPN